MVSRHRARTGELVNAEKSKNVLRNSVSHKQKASRPQVGVTVHEHGDVCLAGKIYYRFHIRMAAERNFERGKFRNKLIKRMKKTYVTSMRSLVFF